MRCFGGLSCTPLARPKSDLGSGVPLEFLGFTDEGLLGFRALGFSFEVLRKNMLDLYYMLNAHGLDTKMASATSTMVMCEQKPQFCFLLWALWGGLMLRFKTD